MATATAFPTGETSAGPRLQVSETGNVAWLARLATRNLCVIERPLIELLPKQRRAINHSHQPRVLLV